MGRKRKPLDIKVIADNVVAIELKDVDGLYPFSTTWSWCPQNGVDQGRVVTITVERPQHLSPEERNYRAKPERFFYSYFGHQYPWAVEAFAVALKTISLDRRVSLTQISLFRSALGEMLKFCADTGVKLDGPQDVGFYLLTAWRSHLRRDCKQSRYKSRLFRFVCSTIERLMGSRYMPIPFTLPIYSSDSPPPLPAYSDVVMYQLIVTALGEISAVMAAYDYFSSLAGSCFDSGTELYAQRLSWKRLVRVYLEDLSLRSGLVEKGVLGDRGRLNNLVGYMREHCAYQYHQYAQNVPYIGKDPDSQVNSVLKCFREKEVPTLETLTPFLLILLIFSGANKETILDWKRLYRVNGRYISPLEWQDPLDSTMRRLRGSKTRGQGKGRVDPEDTYFSIDDNIVYPVIEFWFKYSEPLSDIAKSGSELSLWLYAGERAVMDVASAPGVTRIAINRFLRRNPIWDIHLDADGEPTRTRLMSLDTRRFRKVHAIKEFISVVGEARNFKELASALQTSLHHDNFDLTLAKYLAGGKPVQILELGIHTLQVAYVEEARKFRGSLREQGDAEGTPCIIASCADISSPDFEGSTRGGGPCSEFDMCLGCKQSRVFSIHLPRICMRVIFYEELKSELDEETWDIEYGRKHARALDVLSSWSDRDEVDEAWKAARSGQVYLPKLLARG
ncbi:hypothetical protein [Pseudomonas aeruginosa]|uniref:hypothetical protein n=1 Tax=Pseudomonas aeruginosa TaxID=287 RepID=UPI001114A906|nr:hypothetical protein [Pseudomonas aeruginosa]MCT5519263.1 hypothetical protein [Pseudomonas aeruginosa]MEE2515619.1 hypothetical protein [Pseudomonas aeruginosa]HEJ1327400.1 hypothetical protein [Pseudomonas aeruginosa]